MVKVLPVFLVLLLATSVWAEPRVVVSIKPVHSLVAAVMEGIAEPDLLLSGGESPHGHALRPSQARALAAADLVFWIGPDLETFLVRPLRSLSAGARVVSLLDTPGIELHAARAGGVWEAHHHGHGHDHGHGHHHDKDHKHPKPDHNHKRDHSHNHDHGHADKREPEPSPDAHLWLDPVNARAIVALALAELSELIPAERERLAANAARLTQRLQDLEAELEGLLAPVREVPFVVFHDAYQYLEKRYRLNAVGSITLDPERTPSAQRVREVQGLIRARGARCVFAEPQFTPRLVATVVEGSGARQGVLDPLGADLEPGSEAYFRLLRDLGENLHACLAHE
ncbi:zinc ABC transporter substrate-binding protein [Geoalkalibacter halelectricus]|uniref:Zinc ABC transporter substrate-binding protein n=1 Tax=Geoalkalibacter halelectricus TaxID=2847045 RepID=A0ABY5ZHK4_9BACT|nr:zinc ABC transporter substrate-binding protein [Geoalkalibacter halelectricus]MDO3377795.1 zinc ABC transporter substrate-binding protein [Geoalkalibacter halelectricus]UWZ78612.1 zinc ABC transporter substrate-binding protein [Geoalkalibacter halelectricus]